MRVFYVIKAFQIIVAFVLIARLLFVTKLCESREVTTRNGCSGAMKLAIPFLNTDLNILDAERSVMTATLLRPLKMNVVLTKRDLSLEELHDEGHRRRRGQLNEAEEPKEQKNAIDGKIPRADVVSKVTDSTIRLQTSSPSAPVEAAPVAAEKTDFLKDLKKELETLAKERIGKREAKRNKEFSEEEVIEDDLKKQTEEKANKNSSNSENEEKVEKKDTVFRKEEKPESKATSDKEEEKPGQLDSSAMKEAKLPGMNSSVENERNTVQSGGNAKKEEKSEKMYSNAKILADNEKNLDKEVTVLEAENATNAPVTKLPVIRLRNTVINCMEIDSQDMLGFGDIDLSNNVAFRFPVTCLILSILGGAASVAHAYTNLSRPRKCRTLIENMLQIVLWAVAGFVLFVIRHEWDQNWNNTSNGTFSPDYPFPWYYCELICYAMIVIFLAEIYLYDYVFYKIYIEESLGNYSVVDPPEYGNSIYGTTVEITEDNQL